MEICIKSKILKEKHKDDVSKIYRMECPEMIHNGRVKMHIYNYRICIVNLVLFQPNSSVSLFLLVKNKLLTSVLNILTLHAFFDLSALAHCLFKTVRDKATLSTTIRHRKFSLTVRYCMTSYSSCTSMWRLVSPKQKVTS